jgi:glycosyltransferase involved in cell wall biosynthesis
MRIALLSWESKYSIAVGGLAEHVTELAAALRLRGHEVHVFTRIGEGQSTYDCIDGVHYHRCPFQPHPDVFVDNRRMCDSFVWHLAETESFLNARFDIVHGHDWLSVRAMAQIKGDRSRPVVMTVHSTEFGRCGNQLFEGLSRRIREIEWEGAYVAERVICVSGALLREVQQLYSVPGDKMHVIYNGIDVRRFDARIDARSARRKHAIGMRDPFVLFAGRMTWQKGPDLLVEALPGLLEEHPRAKFVFAGDGDLRDGLERRAAALGVAPATRFVGYRSGRDLVSLFKSADIVCVPSRNEPFGIVILEAWSARKPVVATLNGGPAEFVTHEDTGLTVSDDRDSIGWGVGAVLADKTKGRRMGRAGRREAELRFSWNTIATATERVYQSVLDGRSQSGKQLYVGTEEVSGMGQQRISKAKGSATKTRQAKPKTAKAAGKTTTKSMGRTAKSTRTTAKTDRAKTIQKSMPAAEVTGRPELAIEEIRHRAYEIYLARGVAPGDPMADWLQAERELRGLRAGQAASKRCRR